MKSIAIKTDSGISKILIGENIANLPKYLAAEKTIIITDENIIRIYGHTFPHVPVISIGLGEKNKTLETLGYILMT